MRRCDAPAQAIWSRGHGSQSTILLRGQLGWFRERGWDVHLVSSPGELADQVAGEEHVSFHGLPMERDPSPWSDLTGLGQWIALLRRLRPDVLNVASPKAGLLGRSPAG